MTATPQWKIDLVNKTAEEMSKSPVVAFVSIKGIRNKQLQSIRRNLKGEANIRILRGTLLTKALEKNGDESLAKLKQFIGGQIALITSKDAPSKLYEKLEANRQQAPVKGGEIAEEDIIVEAKDTNFPPGPMISEFQKVGLQAAIEKGKIVIKKESVMVKKGDKISREKAKVLEKLEIFPLNVGLDVITALSEGLLYDKEALSLTPARVMEEIASAFVKSKALATDITFLVKEIIPELLVKARVQAESLAMKADFVDESNMGTFILKALNQANAIAQSTGGDTKKVIEEKKEEEPKEEDSSEGFGALFG